VRSRNHILCTSGLWDGEGRQHALCLHSNAQCCHPELATKQCACGQYTSYLFLARLCPVSRYKIRTACRAQLCWRDRAEPGLWKTAEAKTHGPTGYFACVVLYHPHSTFRLHTCSSVCWQPSSCSSHHWSFSSLSPQLTWLHPSLSLEISWGGISPPSWSQQPGLLSPNNYHCYSVCVHAYTFHFLSPPSRIQAPRYQNDLVHHWIPMPALC
jgi:hypothetical protein